MKNVFDFIFNPSGEVSENRYTNLFHFAVRFLVFICVLYLVWLLIGSLYLKAAFKTVDLTYFSINKNIDDFKYDFEDNHIVISYLQIPDQRISRIRIYDYQKLHLNQVSPLREYQ